MAPTAAATELIGSFIGRVATGPTMSKPLTREEAGTAFALILKGEVDPVQSAVLLIALRMKRETDDENLGVLAALRHATLAATAPVDELVDLADPYDGFARHLPANVFLPAVLAACGVHAVIHGCAGVAPKDGVTHRHILLAANVPVDLSPTRAAAKIADPQCGWAYVDQQQFSPATNALAPLRALIVKRTCISTVEKLCAPIRARRWTHLVAGYVHEGYERLLDMLARDSGFASSLIIRGMEGGVLPRPTRPAPMMPALPKELEGDLPGIARAAADAGLEALHGKRGFARESLLAGAGLVLYHLKQAANANDGSAMAREALDSGRALARFHNFGL